MTLVDVDTNGMGAGVSAGTMPFLTTNGSLVVFEARDGALVQNDFNRVADVYARDLSVERTELISAHAAGLESRTPNGPSYPGSTSVSGDGRWVVFASTADNLVDGDTNQCRDIFLRDLVAGTLTLVSASTNGTPGNGPSSEPAISGDGRYVAFTSLATDLVPGNTSYSAQVFLRDLDAGTNVLVSMNTAGTGPGDKASYAAAVSREGRHVVFRSLSSTVATGIFALGHENLILRDTVAKTNVALTKSGAGSVDITPDGHFVAYVVSNGWTSVCLWDTQLQRLVSSNLFSGGSVLSLALIPDGRRVVCGTSAGLFALDLPEASFTSLDTNGAPVCSAVRISSSGRFIAYTRTAPAPAFPQIYLYDCDAGLGTLVSAAHGGGSPANKGSDSPALSPDGRFLAYRSAAGDIVDGDTNGLPDIFLLDRMSGGSSLLTSAAAGGAPAKGRSLTPVFSGDGSVLLLASWAGDLSAGDFNHASDLFAYGFLNAVLLPGAGTGGNARLSWNWMPGRQYRVEYKDWLEEASWQLLPGTAEQTGNKASLTDTARRSEQRFYRITAY
jgi:Tol biopolymer transport system component